MSDVTKDNIDLNTRYKVKDLFLTKNGSKLMMEVSKEAINNSIILPKRLLRSTFKIKIKDLGHGLEYRAYDLVLRKEVVKNKYDDNNPCLLYEHELAFLIKDINLVYPDE